MWIAEPAILLPIYSLWNQGSEKKPLARGREVDNEIASGGEDAASTASLETGATNTKGARNCERP